MINVLWALAYAFRVNPDTTKAYTTSLLTHSRAGSSWLVRITDVRRNPPCTAVPFATAHLRPSMLRIDIFPTPAPSYPCRRS